MNDDIALEPITGVPRDEVGEIVQSFIDLDDASKVEVLRQPDGKYTIQAFG